MKRLLLAALLTTSTVAANAADVGVSISVGQPGFYGQINIGDAPPPVLINPQPVIIERAQVYGPPIYLHVPPGHIKHWKRYCHHYHACNRHVYFVQDHWYEHEYVPHYREEHRHREYYNKHRREHRERRGDYRDDRRGDRRDDRRDDHRDFRDHDRRWDRDR